MTQTCSKCSRVNPREAAYCYYDGTILGARDGEGGPLNVGTQPFHSPFVFPSGLICRNFEQLALACQENWSMVLELLQQGYLESFLSSLGRIDLALAAREAARFPDRDRGLDQFLSKLPGNILQAPRLHAQPGEINLGLLHVGQDRRFEIALENQGMRLLYGSATCVDCVWLALGDTPGVQQKLFQFHSELALPVHVRGQYLRAGNKPQEGRVVIDSNGGKATVLVRLEVPVEPFPDGILAGAKSPRQIAERAKAMPAEAGLLIENGAVARWYQENGWKFPVQGPLASGVGAVQQFFEALGLVTPPKVDLSESLIRLHGNPGDKIEHALKVTAQEKRPVYAYGASDQPWLEVGRARLTGRVATIPLTVPAVPDQPGQTLHGRLTVTANGNQRFVVPVDLAVGGVPVALPVSRPGIRVGRKALHDLPAAEPVFAVETWPQAPAKTGRSRRGVHLLPIVFLFIGLLAVIVRDVLKKGQPPGTFAEEEELIDPYPRIAVQFQDKPDPDIAAATMRFGLVMLREKDPTNPAKDKRLTYDERGRSNNTCLRLDGEQYIFGQNVSDTKHFGQSVGRWQVMEASLGKDRENRERQGCTSIWFYPDKNIAVTQLVEIVPGAQSRLLDTCLVRYVIENQDGVPHRVGIRFMLDTYIGANDGVPFTLPGARCNTMQEFNDPASIPDYIEALEHEDLGDPGTIAHLSLKLGSPIEPPSRVTLGAWPDERLRTVAHEERAHAQNTGWDVPVLSMQTLSPPDSAVVMYWQEKELEPHARREVGFAYGLVSIASDEGQGELGMTMGGSFTPGGEFTVTAYVRNPRPGQKLRLTLPPGFELLEGAAEQAVPLPPAGVSSRNSPVTWKVRAISQEGRYLLKVQSNTGVSQSQEVTIKSRRLFD